MTQNRFLLRVFVFLAVVVMSVFGVWKAVTWTRDELCRNEKATTLVLGNSRVQFGFDDSLMPGTWNSAVNADNYNVMYWRLKMLHRYNPQLKRVMLLCDQTEVFHYFTGIPDKVHPYYWDVLNLEDWWGLLTHDSDILLNPLHYLKIITPLKSLVSPITYHELGIGGYTLLERDKLNEDMAVLNGDNQQISKPFVHAYNVSYLQKISSYCQEQGLQLIFFNMPSYPTKVVIDGNKYLHQFVAENYPDVPFYDYELIQLPDSCYGDASHLNYRGARLVSIRMREELLSLICE